MLIKVVEKNVDDGKFGFFPGSSLLLSPFSKILSGVLLAGLLSSAVFSVVKVFEIKNLKIELLQVTNENTKVKSQLTECLLTLDTQNAEIYRVKEDSDRDINDLANLNTQLERETRLQYEEIDRLKNKQPPLSCDESTQWLRDNLSIFEEK